MSFFKSMLVASNLTPVTRDSFGLAYLWGLQACFIRFYLTKKYYYLVSTSQWLIICILWIKTLLSFLPQSMVDYVDQFNLALKNKSLSYIHLYSTSRWLIMWTRKNWTGRTCRCLTQWSEIWSRGWLGIIIFVHLIWPKTNV